MDLNVITQTAGTQNFIPQTETNEQVISSDSPTEVADENGLLLGHVDRQRITKALFGKGDIV